jgi:hypothetical protein
MGRTLNTIGLILVTAAAAASLISWANGTPASYLMEALSYTGWLVALLHVRSYLP